MAVDIGGTFVDALVFNFDNGTLETKKVSTTPKAPHVGVLESVTQLVESSDTVGEFIHGTTLGLNAILERKGAAVGIVAMKALGTSLSLPGESTLCADVRI
ncbi:MAG: hypothetical protein CM1200mP41_36840 [Gammaproteobacteria bacterium]|nr:MAG: hypothetical protein CM1200mP41_36840 [Gammaproteobacteria bacterium]